MPAAVEEELDVGQGYRWQSPHKYAASWRLSNAVERAMARARGKSCVRAKVKFKCKFLWTQRRLCVRVCVWRHVWAYYRHDYTYWITVNVWHLATVCNKQYRSFHTKRGVPCAAVNALWHLLTASEAIRLHRRFTITVLHVCLCFWCLPAPFDMQSFVCLVVFDIFLPNAAYTAASLYNFRSKSIQNFILF